MFFSPLTHVRAQELLTTTLAFIAGYVDAFGYITYSTYLSFMSGNTTQTGYRIGEGKFVEALPSFIAILSFVIGVAVGTLLTHPDKSQSQRKVLSFITSLLIFMILTLHLGFENNFFSIAIISFAMGIMNTVITQVGAQLISLTFVTGTLNRIAKHIALGIKQAPLPGSEGPWDTHWHRAAMLARVWCTFFMGALASGIITHYSNKWALVLPIFTLFILIIINPNTKVEQDYDVR